MSNLVHSLYEEIRSIILNARQTIKRTIDTTMVQTYFEVGRLIVEREQGGEVRAEYGKEVLQNVSVKLCEEFGNGFSARNLRRMRSFYLTFKNWPTVSSKLGFSHYSLLMRLDDENARHFYAKEAETESWSVRELDRQINSMLFERLTLSKDKAGVKALATQGQVIENSADLVKDPYILEFLGIPEQYQCTEKELETAIIEDLHHFLLELGKGFTFVSRQKRITVDGDHYFVDLVFYNRLLQCFVLLDLKIGKLTHQDLGQMQMYVSFYDREIKAAHESPTIGIVLCRDKKESTVKYTLPENNKQIFASKYKLYLPTEDELLREVDALAGRLEKH